MATGEFEPEIPSSPFRAGSVGSFTSRERVSTSSFDFTDVEGEPPELTDRFLHDLLASSNITKGHVKQLGLHLSVKNYQITQAIDAHPNDPALQAVTIYHFWHRSVEGSDPLTVWQEFRHALKKVGLGRACKQMGRGGRCLQTDKGECTYTHVFACTCIIVLHG